MAVVDVSGISVGSLWVSRRRGETAAVEAVARGEFPTVTYRVEDEHGAWKAMAGAEHFLHLYAPAEEK